MSKHEAMSLFVVVMQQQQNKLQLRLLQPHFNPAGRHRAEGSSLMLPCQSAGTVALVRRWTSWDCSDLQLPLQAEETEVFKGQAKA